MESGPAPAHPLTEPGRTTVQLLVACSAVLALLQLVASTSVDVFNGERAGWWVAIQGSTVAFSAAFAGAAAGANGAWWRRMQEKSGSTTPKSLATAVASGGMAGVVFAVLCWAASSLGEAAYPMALAVLVAALMGGVCGGFRAGGAILGGLVATFVATLVNLTGQALNTIFVLAPAVSAGRLDEGNSLPFSVATWSVSVVAGTIAGISWLARRRQRTKLWHCLVIGLFPVSLIVAGALAGLIAWALVDDPAKSDALVQARTAHGVQLAVFIAGGILTALVASRSVRTRRPVTATGGGASAGLDTAPVAAPPPDDADGSESSRSAESTATAGVGTSDTPSRHTNVPTQRVSRLRARRS